MERRTDRRRWLTAAVIATATVLALAGCSADDDDGTTAGSTAAPGTTPTADTAAPASAVDYADRGPYEVGRTTLDLDGVEVFVYYPADEAGTAEAEHLTEVSSDLAFPESFREIAPPFFIQQLDTDVYLDAPASTEGPFPLVLHSHGFSGYPLYATGHLEHTASWGYVVAAPSHPSRNLAASLGGGGGDAGPDADVVDLENTTTRMEALNEDATSVLFGTIDPDRLAAEGHSAGGGAVGQLALRDDRLSTIIGQAPGAPVDLTGVDRDAPDEERAAAIAAALAGVTPPELPVLYLAGERDGVIPLTAVQAVFEWLAPPKQLVVVANAGHNPFLDICAPLAAQGGLVANAGELAENPAIAPLLELGEDGCIDGYLEPALGYDLIDHTTVAWLRWVFGDDDTTAALSPEFLEATFPEATGPVESDLGDG